MEKKLLLWICFLLFMLSGKAQIVESSSSSRTYRMFSNYSSWELLTKEKILEKNLPYKYPDLTKKSYQLPMEIPQNIGDDNSIAYGFLVFDNKFQTRGVAALSTGNPNGVEMINRYGASVEDFAICAGTMVGDDYWGYLYVYYDMGTFIPVGLGKIDLASGEFTKIFDYGRMEFLFAHMTYDVKNNVVWAIRIAQQNMEFYTIDMESGIPNLKGSSDRFFYTIASDDDGSMYGVGDDGNLYKISTEDFTSTLIGDTGERPGYSQSMSFDHTTHTLWWAGCSEEAGWFCSIDTQTGRLTNKKIFENHTEIVALAIPYQKVIDEAPSCVRNLKATPGEGGTNEVALTWTNPTTNYRKRPLSDLTSIEIYRNGKLVYTYNTTESGKEMSWKDEVSGSGHYEYKVIPVNTFGTGLYKTVKTFVGKDIPGWVESLTVKVSGDEATLSWGAPLSGANSGWYDSSTLKYKVYRMPGHIELTDTDKKSYVDKVSVYDIYNYIVQAYNKEGMGTESKSPTLTFGPSFKPPYSTSFETINDFDKMNVINANNDQKDWSFYSWEKAAGYSASHLQANDFLVTPYLSLKADEVYQVEFVYGTHPGANESIRIVAGKELNPDKLNIEIADFPEIIKGVLGKTRTGGGRFTVPEDGDYHVAFHCYSKPLQNYFMIYNISVKKVFGNDLSAVLVTGPDRPACKDVQIYQVRVVNKGMNDQENYSVRLIDNNTNTVLSEVKVDEKIASGDSVTISLSWTPDREGKVALKAQTLLKVDEDTSNDTSEVFVVEVAPEGSPIWVQIGQKENTSMYCPFTVNYKSSVCQTIYYADELKATSGSIIKGIAYEYDEFNDNLETDVEVYVKNITENELDGFIGKPEDFEKVYEGILTMPSGQNWSTLVFDKDFEYTGDNICVMTIRPTDIEYRPGVFNIFEDPSRPNRCWTYYNDRVEYDFADPDAINPSYYHSSENIPVTKIGFRFKSVGITDNVVSNCELTQHNDRIQFNMVCSTVRIVDVTGKTIGSYRNTDQITIQSLPKGIYIIEFICNDQSNVEKILLY